MKRMISGCMIVLLLAAFCDAKAQQVDNDRMTRDIRVAENVLATMIKQKMEGTNTFFTLEVTGSYQPGYGVTFTLPADYTTPVIFGMSPATPPAVMMWQDAQRVNSDAYVISPQLPNDRNEGNDWKLKDRRQLNLDSVRDLSNQRLIEAAREFLADYGDILSQVQANEKITITNRGAQPRLWVGQLIPAPSRSHISIDVKRSDLLAFRQGKISRDEVMKRINVLNAQATHELEPDLELLSTIFSRLYRPDLSKTYFTEGNLHYEHLKDYGVVYYMQVFSANRTFTNSYDMPTVGLRDVDQTQRDNKVKELYPQFEKELKENIVEYGRTTKSIGDNEALIFNVTLTRCDGCGIPSSLEMSVKGSALQNYNNGKISKNQILDQVEVKRSANQ